MLKDMYDEGDDKMKEIIGNAMLKSREGKDDLSNKAGKAGKKSTPSSSSNNNSSKLNTSLDLPEGLDDEDY